jgi:beta-glucosidase
VDEGLDRTVRRSQEHLHLSLEVARESMCLLQNRNNLLPLKKNLRRIAVIGPNAELVRLGDYADAATETAGYGMLSQIKNIVSPQTKIDFSAGRDIQAAVALAKRADVVILALGENSRISGEGHDRSELDLPGNQENLLEAVAKTGVPAVLVLQNGRALTIPWAVEHVSAILEAWYPGEFGGRAIAETLFGDNNPAGRLPVSFPISVGQLPVFYNHFPSRNNSYIDEPDSPLFVFGFGLSYTAFKYGNLTVTGPKQGNDDVLVSFDLANTGAREGDEVAQLYVRQTTASVATPIIALKGFSRVHLTSGQVRHLTLRLKQSDLAVWGATQTWKIEPGEYKVTVGGNSDAHLSAGFLLK